MNRFNNLRGYAKLIHNELRDQIENQRKQPHKYPVEALSMRASKLVLLRDVGLCIEALEKCPEAGAIVEDYVRQNGGWHGEA